VHVNGSWITPRGQTGFRGPARNHTLHEVPLPKSLMHEELLPRVKELLALCAEVEENDPANAWPRTIVYRNLRHHAATKWFHDELGEPWEVSPSTSATSWRPC
jgi:hypothetical protein